MKISVRLPRGEWFFDDARPLGRAGGFGEVFEGEDGNGNTVAVKRLKVTAAQAAHRELAIAEELAGRQFENVLAPTDSGQDANTGAYYLVMPRADKSLADELASRGAIPAAESVDVLTQIASGLREIPQIVHRDLKPANIRFHQGRWKIADFGIARFVEEATSLNTVKDCLSPPFAAPEQWNGEHATGATDIYALCCIAYALLTGQPPFPGPNVADYRQQHVSASPPALALAEPRLRVIVSAGLRKPQNGRPSISRVFSVLKEVASNTQQGPPAITALHSINASEAERVSRIAAKAEEDRRASEARESLISAGEASMREILQELARVASDHLSEAVIVEADNVTDIRIGRSARLHAASTGYYVPPDAFEMSKWRPVAMGIIQVSQEEPHPWKHGATLWYMAITESAEYRWYEVSYKRHAFSGGPLVGPFPIQDVSNEMFRAAASAAAPGMSLIEIQFGPEAIDDENVARFTQRWLERLALAYQGRLRGF